MHKKLTRSASQRAHHRGNTRSRGFEHRIKRFPLRSSAAINRHCSLFLTNARRRGLLTPDCRNEF